MNECVICKAEGLDQDGEAFPNDAGYCLCEKHECMPSGDILYHLLYTYTESESDGFKE